MSKIIIAIDGHTSCGKSTLSQALARELYYKYITSGAMYRAFTLFYNQEGIDPTAHDEILTRLDDVHIHFELKDGETHTMLNGEDVEGQIRTPLVNDRVSQISTISEVRKAVVRQLRTFGKDGGLVMDGRDIGTVVFPEAVLKIFLTAKPEVRIVRRFEELQSKGRPQSMVDVRKNVLMRDHIDSTREDSPLRQAEDAVVIDNTNLDREEQLAMVKALALSRIHKQQK